MLCQSVWFQQGTVAWCNRKYDIEVEAEGPASRKCGDCVYGDCVLAKAMRRKSNVVFSNGDMVAGGGADAPVDASATSRRACARISLGW